MITSSTALLRRGFLFRGDLIDQRSRLLTMITAMVGSLDQPEVFESIVADLTSRHPGYGVRLEHYGPFEEALIWSLCKCLGPDFTPETESAWRGLFQMLSPGGARDRSGRQ
jgi:hemoglobin-like flavoprotein